MDSKKLVKLIEKIVEKKVNTILSEILGESITQPKSIPEQKNLRTLIGDELDVYQTPKNRAKKEYTNNPILNQILNETEPFQSKHRIDDGGLSGFGSGMEINESSKTLKADSNLAPLDRDSFRAAMAAKMGYDTIGSSNTNAPKSGLGIETGLPHLDRVLNRDNTELVKKMMEASKK